MKALYYIGLVGLMIFEIANVYFIMPMPGSQQYNSIELAYFLYSYRWVFRVLFLIMIVLGAGSAFRVKRPWLAAVAAVPVLIVAYQFNFEMTADHMFLEPRHLAFSDASNNTLNDSSIVIAAFHNNEAKAYPIRYIQYHHQVRDTLGGKPVMVTYCNVCRTGRVFEPTVGGKPEKFRLVGMDHFNAMFEDATTGSWWRQANGEAITGELKGSFLPEVESGQFTLKNFFAHYPNGLVMNADADFKGSYDTLGRFEKGRSRGQLTRTDSLSWQKKSWVLGIEVNGKAKAYDWLELKKVNIINDRVGDVPVVVAIAADAQTFIALERPADSVQFTIRNDSLISDKERYDFAGRSAAGNLKGIKAYQEFWHSWKQFHPETDTYNK